jgi:hypothetical protein
MTRNHLRRVLLYVMTTYALAMGVGVGLRRPFAEQESAYYKTYKDLLPLIIAIPAAYLVFAFQRRGSYLQALRGLWTQMVSAVSGALLYTNNPAPTQDQYLTTLNRLSIAIEEVRGVFKNVPAPNTPDGWFPFEPVKQIYQEILELGFAESATAERRTASREKIYDMWKRSRSQLLAEFDREEPTHHHAAYAPNALPQDIPAPEREG